MLNLINPVIDVSYMYNLKNFHSSLSSDMTLSADVVL